MDSRVNVAIGDTFSVAVERASVGGEVVARAPDGRVLFLGGAAPGDRVRVAVTEVERRFLRGRLLEIEQPGPDHVASFCPVADQCGGCPWSRIAPAAQHQALDAHVHRTLRQAAGEDYDALPMRAPEPGLHWRSTARVHVDGRRFGYFAPGTRTLVEPPGCAALAPELETLWRHAATHAESVGIAGIGTMRLTSGPGAASGSITLETETGTRKWDAWAAAMVNGPCHGVRLRWPNGDTRDFGTVEDRLGPNDVPHPTGSFVQAHQPGMAALVAEAVEWMGGHPGDPVLELYAGSGNFSFALAAAGLAVTAVEADRDAAYRLRAEANRRAQRIEVIAGDAARLPRGRWSAVLMDPPRAGARPVLAGLAALRPARLVYVSCDPATLGRDVAELVRAGARVARARAWALFPHTGHVETVALLTFGKARRGAGGGP
jgi:23S rRNA (uracil1939-C5)-methyltransferase